MTLDPLITALKPTSPAGSSLLRNALDPWSALEQLLQRLTESTGTLNSVTAAVDVVREAVGADGAYWYSRNNQKVTAYVGSPEMPNNQAVTLAMEMLERLPPDRDVILWSNPTGRAEDGIPDAAIAITSPKTTGCIICLSFDPGRIFDENDSKTARLAMKLLLAQRTQIQAGTKQLLLGLLHCLTTIIDAKDPYTAGHSERVARIAVLIVKELQLGPQAEGDIYLAGLLHDVGKIGVRDEILQRSGKLTVDEMDEIRQTPVIGERIVASIKPFERLRPAVRHHHEWFNGSGYPDRLAGEKIPLLARILAVADACDAMMSPRRFRAARSPHDIDRIFLAEAGIQFDPLTVKAFMAIRHDIYPPIYQKGIGDSAYHAIESIVDNFTDGSMMRLPNYSDRKKN